MCRKRNLLIWSIEPAQNFPKNFLAPRALKSWITNGHKCNTLFLVIRSRFSITTTLAPNNWASMAARSPHGPAPMINTWKLPDDWRNFFYQFEVILIWKAGLNGSWRVSGGESKESIDREIVSFSLTPYFFLKIEKIGILMKIGCFQICYQISISRRYLRSSENFFKFEI